MDLEKIPPIQQKRIVTFVNYFIIDTVSFLNKFINASENTLWKLEKRMRKLDTTLKLLEAKLSFIPESPETASTSHIASTSNFASTAAENNADSKKQSEENIEDENTEDKKPDNEEVAAEPKADEEIPEEVQKYVKMVKVGVPVEAVKLKMKNDGLDPASLKLA